MILPWRRLVPSDGATTPHTLSGSRVAEGTKLYRGLYTLSIVCSRNDNQPWRSMEGMTIMQNLLELLTDRKAVDHEPLSHPAGLQILSADRASVSKADFQRWIIYTIDVATQFSITRRELRTFTDWLRSHLMVDKAVGPDFPEGDIRVANVLVDMNPNLLEVGGQYVDGGGENVEG